MYSIYDQIILPLSSKEAGEIAPYQTTTGGNYCVFLNVTISYFLTSVFLEHLFNIQPGFLESDIPNELDILN